MLTINGWNDLRQFGIDVLTGEACGLSYRLLCDVTKRGKQTLEKALGAVALELADNWNNGSATDPHVGSVMLVPELLVPLGIFALLEHGCSEVWRMKSGTLLGIEAGDDRERLELLERVHVENENFVRRYAYAGTAGDRNKHQMTGRIM